MNSKQPISFLSSSSPTLFIFCAFVIFLTCTIRSDGNDANDTDREALLKIKSLISHDPYGALTSWNNSFHYCDWNHVLCGKRHRRVVYMNLSSQGLEGFLSPQVGNLSFLRTLSLANNSFQGAIPHELGRLFRLRYLALYRNKFSGVIPANISGCFNLERISLSENELVGSIPKEISFLSKLTFLSLFNNKLTGEISPFLGNITTLELLSLKENRLGGSIPSTLGQLKSLKELYLGGCNLYGTIPDSLYNLSLLAYFSLASNQLTGNVHSAIGGMLPNLVFVQLWGNNLTGPIPPSISNCSKLEYLEMEENKFSGKLTVEFAKLKDIYYINLSNNLFGSEEADDMKFISSLGNCTNLLTLALDNCKFQGVLPGSIGNLSIHLREIYMGGNQLRGNIPSSIGNLVGLVLLPLESNQFTGSIPSTIGNLQNLQFLDLSRCQLSGTIPDAIGNLSSFINLHVFSNKLEGEIPSSLGNFRNLLDLYLGDNKLTGKIPRQIFQLLSLSIILDLSHNKLFGSLPTEVGDLKMLSLLNLAYNDLSGNIPSSLGGCGNLVGLSLEGNLFQGMIPSSFSSLKGLSELDISHNNLSGTIPRFLENMKLEYLNLSYNDFEGEVPMGGVFFNESAFSILGNSRLCGGFVKLGLPKCKKKKNYTKKFHIFLIVTFITSIALFTITCLACIWSCKKKRKRHHSDSLTTKGFIKVTYNQLLKATNGFSESNLIGKGGFGFVYKGKLCENDDKFVAIKVLHLQNRGAHGSFLRECEAWQNIRHRNLLKIITSCSSIDFQGNQFKALVYEFMPNGNLHYWLYSSEHTTRLKLLQKIKILRDISYALDYIHSECLPTIVHGDLKPSNILLDDDMVAHVGDFGLARVLGTSYLNNSTGIRGTVGYVAPEYGMGSEMTSSGDVYSFGILVLEVMTGKEPTSDIFNEHLSLHKYASMALQDHVTGLLDVNIIKDYEEDKIAMRDQGGNVMKIDECLASTIKIGVSCSMHSPTQRMDIKRVVHELQQVLSTLENI